MKIVRKLLILVIVFASMNSIYGGMTNGGTFTVTNSVAWASVMNKKTGVINGTGGTFLDILNYGTVNLDDCIMTEEVKNYGTLDAAGTLFQNNLIVCSGNIALNNCKLENIFIEENESEWPLPYVIITGSTLINGSIIFTTGQGKVYKDSSVVILGEVVNGSLTSMDE